MAQFIKVDAETIINTDHIVFIDVNKKGKVIVMMSSGTQFDSPIPIDALIKELKRPRPLQTISAAQPTGG